MLELNEKLFRTLKEKYHVDQMQISLLMETMAFIEMEVLRDVQELDGLANMVINLMDKEGGHNAIELIPTIKEIKENCNKLTRRLEKHKTGIAAYERSIKRARRTALDKNRKIIQKC